MNTTLLSLKDISFEYEKDNKILNNISFDITAGESVGIIGANGVGKSTLMKLLVGLQLGYKGDITVSNLPVNKNNLSEIRQKIGYVFQDSDSQLFMNTAYEDIAFAPNNYGYSKSEVEQRVQSAIEMINIEYLKDKQIYKMSGGEKKLVSIATILAMTPEIIIMDEPSVGLDPRNRRRLINILNSFTCVKLITSHDLDLILDTCERTILLSEGAVISDGPTKEILYDKELLESNGLELPLKLQ